jgi:hypothetical protein
MIPSEKTRNKVLVLKPEGRLDSNTINAAEAEMFSYLEKGETRIVIDLSGLDYIQLRPPPRPDGQAPQPQAAIALCEAQATDPQVFEISGFISIITVLDTAPRPGCGRPQIVRPACAASR